MTDAKPPAPKQLVCKLAEVMAAVHRIPKDGRNEFHKYDYATEAAISEAIRGALADRQIMIIPQVVEVTQDGPQTAIKMLLTICDGESGETIGCHWAGVAQDKGDKALWKAITGAVKYFLMKTFLVPTGDDPEEAKGEGGARPQQAAEGAPVPPTGPKPAGSYLIAEVNPREVKSGKYAGKTKWQVVTDDGQEWDIPPWSSALAAKAEDACKFQRPCIFEAKEPRERSNGGFWPAEITGISTREDDEDGRSPGFVDPPPITDEDRADIGKAF